MVWGGWREVGCDLSLDSRMNVLKRFGHEDPWNSLARAWNGKLGCRSPSSGHCACAGFRSPFTEIYSKKNIHHPCKKEITVPKTSSLMIVKWGKWENMLHVISLPVENKSLLNINIEEKDDILKNWRGNGMCMLNKLSFVSMEYTREESPLCFLGEV